MDTNETKKFKAYHLAFSFYQQIPGVITIPAATPEEAEAKLMEMLKDYNGTVVHQIMDLDDVPSLKSQIDLKALIEGATDLEPIEDGEDAAKKKLN